ncbi:MAG: hypothetical protein KG003_00115 [Bacteroidetes bacterium]|nr:hypothetical protein [Bacteroidota bacterium]
MKNIKWIFTGILFLLFVANCKKKETNKEDPKITKSSYLLQHDSFPDNGTSGFQSGFVAGEAAAVYFGPVDKEFQIKKIKLLFGGAVGDSSFILKIQKDSSGFPGQVVFSSTYKLPGNSNIPGILDLSGNNVVLAAGSFFVVVTMTHNGLPSVAVDKDGTINNTHNFIFVSGLGWSKSSTYGLSGDWIIRAEIEK